MKTNPEKWQRALQIASVNEGVDVERILGKSRLEHIAVARHLARWIAVECMDLSVRFVEQVSKANYTTITWSIRRINELRDIHPMIKNTTEQIKKSIANENRV